MGGACRGFVYTYGVVRRSYSERCETPELPIEQQPTIVELINNLKTAKIRGPALPPTLHAQFNEMID